MDNRFGLKDLLQTVLLLGVIASIWLGMKQYDRQWELVRTVNQKVDTQTREMSRLRRLIEAGPAVAARVVPGQSQPQPAPKGQPDTPADQQATRDQDDRPFDRIEAARSQEGYTEGDWLVDAFGGGVAKLTPLLSGDVYASIIQNYVLDTLATRDPSSLQWKGLLAKSWQISDDGLTITFQLRQGVTFSDGHPLTAEDVVYTFDLIMNEQIAAPRHRAYLKTIESVEMNGPYEVTFRYKEPYFEAFELAASIAAMPKHFYSAYMPEQFNQSVGLLLGSGQYRLEDPTGWTPSKPIQLVRNDRYWGVPAAFDRLVFKEITNDVARQTAFRNGDIDLFAAQPQQYRDMLNDEALASRTQHYEYLSPASGYRYLAWNQSRNGQPTVFTDKRVRQAMTLLTNRPQLVQEIMLGYAVTASGPFNPLSKQISQAVVPWAYDVARAKALLQEAGFQDNDKDGVLETPQGEPFEFKLTYPSGSTNYEKMVLFLKDAYARAGIVLVPDPLEWSVFTERLKNKDFAVITLGWTSGIETDVYQMFHSSQIPDGGDNFISYSSPELDGLIETARRTVDEDTRMPMWHRAHEILHEDQPYTFLFFSKSLRFIDNRVRNVQELPMGLSPSEEWWVPADLQKWKQ